MFGGKFIDGSFAMPIHEFSVFAPAVMRDCLFVASGLGDSGPEQSGNDQAERVLKWENSLLNMCLYADKVYVPTFVSEDSGYRLERGGYVDAGVLASSASFGWRDGKPMALGVHESFSKVSSQNRDLLYRMFDRLLPLIKSNIIELYNPYEIFYGRISRKLLGKKRWFTQKELDTAWPNLFVAEGLLFAEHFGVPYTAVTQSELSAIQDAAVQAQRSLKIDQKLMFVLPKLSVPSYVVDPKALVEARMNSQEFEEARSSLRGVARLMETASDDPHLEREVTQFYVDEFLPQMNGWVANKSSGKGLHHGIKEAGIDFSAGALAAVTLAADIAETLASGGMTALSRVILQRILTQDKSSATERYFQSVFVHNQPQDFRMRLVSRF